MRPTTLSCEYVVRIVYNLGTRPAVHIIEPKLQSRDGKPPPHLYPGEELCLYRGQYLEWTPQHIVSETIIPWISEWLECYECWLVTGDWPGGGEHPKPRGNGRY